MRKYIVIEEQKNGTGDRFECVCDTIESANYWGDLWWYCLTKEEQKQKRVHVVSVEDNKRYLYDDAWPDEGVDYTAFHSADIEDDYFDSERSER